MSKVIKPIISIIGWIVLLAAFGSLGFTSDNPAIGVPVFLIFFLLAFGLVYLYIKKHHKRQEVGTRANKLVQSILGIILIILALLSPTLVFRSAKFPFFTYLILTLITAILIALGGFAVSMINNIKGKGKSAKWLGYILLLILSAVPALIMTSYDSSYNALGMVYYSAILISIFSWWGFSLYFKKD